MRISNWLDRLTSALRFSPSRRTGSRCNNVLLDGTRRRRTAGDSFHGRMPEALEARCMLTTLTGAHATVGIQSGDGSFIS